jgi:hypothetical protein
MVCPDHPRSPENAAYRILLARGAGTRSNDLLETEDTLMHLDDAIADHLQAFNEELAGGEWSASAILPNSEHICLRIERRTERDHDPAPHALEICRRTFAEAAKSARKHIAKQA